MFNRILLGYSEELDELLEIVEVSLIKKQVTLALLDGKTKTFSLDKVKVVEEIGEFAGEVIFNHDVFSVTEKGINIGIEESLMEIELVDKYNLVLHSLDDNLNRISSGEKFHVSEWAEFEDELGEFIEIFGNRYELQSSLPKIDFNVKIVRENINGEIQYSYACNNKQEELVDLLKVVFVGSELLEEEYERVSLTYEGYLDSVKRGIIEEASPQELLNYVTGLTYGKPNQEDTNCEDLASCKKCSKQTNDCECDLW